MSCAQKKRHRGLVSSGNYLSDTIVSVWYFALIARFAKIIFTIGMIDMTRQRITDCGKIGPDWCDRILSISKMTVAITATR
jgi:hypothetical protein